MLYELREVTRQFHRAGSSIAAIDRFSLRIATRELLAIVGPSGCGKTTLLQVLGAIDTDFAGEVLFDGQELKRLGSVQRAQLRLSKIGIVLQNFQLIDALTVMENIALPHWRLHGDRRRAEVRARELARQFAIEHRLSQRPQNLSIGEMQRTAVARALVCDPAVVLADEPTASLDAENGRHIIASLRAIADSGRTVVVASHDPAVMASARRTVTLAHGRLLTDCESAAVALVE